MRRCPECGFRANDKTCPLCGVRMRELPGAAQELKTHTHKQDGERCALPNQERTTVRPSVREQPRGFSPERPRNKQEKKAPQVQLPPKLLPILAVILIVLLRGCMS